MKPIKQDTRFNFFINSEIISGGNFKKIIQRVLGGVSGRGRPQALGLNLRDSTFTLEIGSSFRVNCHQVDLTSTSSHAIILQSIVDSLPLCISSSVICLKVFCDLFKKSSICENVNSVSPVFMASISNPI